MNHTYDALKKILNELVPEQYPDISGIIVVEDEWDGTHKYKIFLGIEPEKFEFSTSDVRDYVKQISKYVLGNNETISQILFYNSENISKP